MTKPKPKQPAAPKPLTPMERSLEATPSWLAPPKLIPTDYKYITTIKLGINTKDQIEKEYQQMKTGFKRVPKL